MLKIINNKIYIDCFFYGFYIEKNELKKYKTKNQEDEIFIYNLINTNLVDNS
tara:strand:- start:132 stop:287 length:156 start_codon:yes stop_codon:yes gene_type:complete